MPNPSFRGVPAPGFALMELQELMDAARRGTGCGMRTRGRMPSTTMAPHAGTSAKRNMRAGFGAGKGWTVAPRSLDMLLARCPAAMDAWHGWHGAVLCGDGCSAAATSHQCPLEAAAQAPSRCHPAQTPAAQRVLLGCWVPPCSTSIWGSPQGSCPKGGPVPPGHPGCKAESQMPPNPLCQGGDPPLQPNPHPSTYWSSPTFFTQAMSRSDWSWGESRHPIGTRTRIPRDGGRSRMTGPCSEPAPACPAGASAPPAAARTRP